MHPFTRFSLKAILSVLLFVGVSSPALHAAWNDSIRWNAELNATFSAGENTPFWLVSNLQGLSSVERNSGYVRLSAFHDMDTTRRFTWGAGVDLAVPWRYSSPFVVQQLYGEVKYRCLQAMLGSKEMWGCYNDPRLSSGNLLYSGNSRPIPQLRLGIFDYADIWGTRGWLGIKGYIAFGMFTDDRWQRSWVAENTKHVDDVLYHSKGLWLRNGNPDKFPLVFEAGIEMATQFGGVSYENGKAIHMPHGLKDWFKAVVPLKGGEDTPDGEQVNVQGNMVGNWNFCLSWLPKEDWSVKAYFEHFFEDHSMLYIDYRWRDGLWGVEATFPKNPVISAFVYEFLHLKDQSGPLLNDTNDGVPEQVSGNDNYYNHYIYPGWQHWGMGIGNPMVLSPIFNRNNLLYFRSNRVVGHHFGFSGNPTSQLSYRVLISYSRNWGTYNYPLEQEQDNFNALAEVTWTPKKLKGWQGTLSLAGDSGPLMGKSFGVGICISKTGWLKF
ncbi:MAG: capsule assembly Wzi family protein [Bacteroides sp.]|nr:capsule assembly Wzi family protein [Bacteroides sp.]